jgi:hypothetical protein
MSSIDRKPISRVAAAAAFGLAIALGVSACGGSPASKSTTNTTAGSAAAQQAARSAAARTGDKDDKGGSVFVAKPTTTVKPPPVTPTFLDIQACRSFVSFRDFAIGGGSTAELAKGEVGGMINLAQQASAKAGGKGAPAKLVVDLQALLTVTQSAKWTGRASEAKLPQVSTVAADCKPVLS